MWRSEFARHLREQGVRANATDRLSRGRIGRSMPDGLFRADERKALTQIKVKTYEAPIGTISHGGTFSAILEEIRQGWIGAAKAISFRPEIVRQVLKPAPPDLTR